MRECAPGAHEGQRSHLPEQDQRRRQRGQQAPVPLDPLALRVEVDERLLAAGRRHGGLGGRRRGIVEEGKKDSSERATICLVHTRWDRTGLRRGCCAL